MLTGQADGVIMIVKARSTSREQIRRTVKQLGDVKVKILGAVLNRLDLKKEGYYYRYHYDHQFDQKSSSGKKHRKAASRSMSK